MTAEPFVPGQTVVLRPRSRQLAEVPSAYAEPHYEKHVVRHGPAFGLRPPRWAATALWATVVVGAAGVVLKLLLMMF
jgi:hypothetical protein